MCTGRANVTCRGDLWLGDTGSDLVQPLVSGKFLLVPCVVGQEGTLWCLIQKLTSVCKLKCGSACVPLTSVRRIYSGEEEDLAMRERDV
jgi:hypothetical protein